jgi:hypothetical protein
MDNWHPISDHPPNGKHVLIYDVRSESIKIAVVVYQPLCNTPSFYDEYSGKFLNVSHYMQLPEVPA